MKERLSMKSRKNLCWFFPCRHFKKWKGLFFTPKFEKRLKNPTARVEFLESLHEMAHWVEPEKKIMVCRDEKDNKFLEAGVAEQVKQIITGDRDLLALNQFVILFPGRLLDEN